jgi:hypothetical protein
MPRDIHFDLPFPLRISPDMEGARPHNLDWVRQQGLVGSERSVNWYSSWDMPRLAAYGFPDAQGPELDLCTDAMAFFFVFDDQFDGPSAGPPIVSPGCARASLTSSTAPARTTAVIPAGHTRPACLGRPARPLTDGSDTVARIRPPGLPAIHSHSVIHSC